MKNCFYSLIIFIILGWLLSNHVFAKEIKKVSEIKESVKYECKLISRGEAINQAQRKMSGKIIGIKLIAQGERSVYRVRMLIDNKRVKNISINACR